jgi:hypothetical protein
MRPSLRGFASRESKLNELSETRTSLDLARDFESLVADIFRAEGFAIEQADDIWGTRPDLILREKGRAFAIVEIKLVRSRTATASMLVIAARTLEAMRTAAEAAAAILVVGSVVNETLLTALRHDHPSVIFYDLRVIASLAAKTPGLLQRLNEIVRDATPFSEPSGLQPAPVDPRIDISEASKAGPAPLTQPANAMSGKSLCDAIRSVSPGKRQAAAFESRVTYALKYLFSTDLTAWSPQKATDTQMSRFDLVARVASDHDLWSTIRNQFRSRYVVFEFKNYTEKIKQGQIYTTEKYLFANALRATAFLISRNGGDRNAEKAARGALRESGKLIALLTVDDICKMLSLRDRGEDHNSVLVERLDDILMKLER